MHNVNYFLVFLAIHRDFATDKIETVVNNALL